MYSLASPLVVLLLAAAATQAGLAAYAWQRCLTTSAGALAWLALLVAVWDAGYALELAAPALEAKVAWAAVQYIGIVGVPVAWLIFTAQYSQTPWLSRRVLALLLVVPALTWLLLLTNDSHRLIWRSVAVAEGGAYSALAVQYGPWFWVHVAFSYLAILLGSVLLLRTLARSPVSRWHSLLLLLAAAAPWTGNIVYVFRLGPLYPLDPTPFAFAASALLLGWGLFRFHIFDQLPLAHSAIIAGMRDGVLVLNPQNVLVDLNPVAQAILGRPAADLIGKPVAKLRDTHPELVERCCGQDERPLELAAGTGEDQRFYDVHVSDLWDQHSRVFGRLVALRDVTQRRQIEDAQRFLINTGTLLASSLDPQVTLATIARLAVPQLADWCLILLAENGQVVRLVAFTFGDTSKHDLAAELQRSEPIAPDAPHGYPYVLRTGQPELVAEISDEWLAALARDDQQLNLLRAMELRSAVTVPLVARGQTIGVISFGATGARAAYAPADLDLALGLAKQAALAVDNARLFQRAQRRVAELNTVQHVASTINSTLNLDTIFQTIVTQIRAAFGYQMVSIYLREGDGLALQAYVGYDEVIAFIPLSSGVSGRVARTGQPAYLRDVSQDPDFLAAVPGIRQMIIHPLKVGDQPPLGTLAVESTGVPQLADDDFALLGLLADQVGVALVNARLIKDLRVSEQAAGVAAQAKSEFLANISHEVRTPISGVIGVTDALAQTPLTARQRGLVDLIRTSGRALLAIINDILDFSKVESGKLELEHLPWNLVTCVEEALDLVAISAVEKRLDLAYTVDPDVPRVLLGDCGRVRQVLVNLLGNAIKFTNRGEVLLSIGARPLADQRYELRFAVRDTGIGIPADRIDRLFKSFSQVDASTSRRYGGTGLGLAISKRLSEAMGGTIGVESAPGAGSTFSFTIVADADLEHGRFDSADPQPALNGRRLLIVDANEPRRRALARAAETWGIRPEAHSRLEPALAQVRASAPFDAVLLVARHADEHPPDVVAEVRRQGNHLTPLLVASLPTPSARGIWPASGEASATLNIPIKVTQLREALVALFAQPEQAAAPRHADPLRVLLVEDDMVNQKLGLYLLDHLGHQAEAADCGAAAIDTLARHWYDLVLLDVQMPDIDGFEVARFVRQRWPDDRLRPYVVAVSANALPSSQPHEATAMDGYIGKPLTLTALNSAVEQLQQWRSSARSTDAIERAVGDQPAPIDSATWLRQAAALGDNAVNFRAEVVRRYLDDAPAALAAMRAAAASGDGAALGRAAHKLKSSSAIVAATELSRLCDQLERHVAEPRAWSIVLGQIEHEFSRVEAALGQH